MMADNFEEKSGLVKFKTRWGSWGQTIEEIFIEVNLPENSSSKSIVCDLKSKSICVKSCGSTIIEGQLYDGIVSENSIWTLEDKCLLSIVLEKTIKNAANCWKSLLKDEYNVDPLTFESMEKKLTLERFQKENPGMDFSKADVTGNFHGGGPILPEKS